MLVSRALGVLTIFGIAGCAESVGEDSSSSVGRSYEVIDIHLSTPLVDYETYKEIRDPTGTAPTPRVERFELRGGDCLGNDCIPVMLDTGPNTRGRVENEFIVDWGEGDTGVYEYWVYVPSGEYTAIESLGTTMGQLLTQPDSDPQKSSFEFFNLEVVGQNVDIAYTTGAADRRLGRHIRVPVGRLGSTAFPYDKWNHVKVDFRLSSQSDGYVAAFVNGRPIGGLTGVTHMQNAGLEYKYGIYQSGTNTAAKQYGGNLGEIPPQVVYFSGIKLRRARQP
jgi:hypothetical protein